MRFLPLVFPFIALTMFCWGIYGPTIHAGQFSVEPGSPPSSLKPLICVGIAYFLIAVLVPIGILKTKGEKGGWSTSGTIWSLGAGAAGAIGALGIILAFKFRGSPVYVMPLVFGCAPVVNTFFTMLMARSFKEASWAFYFGVLVVAIGAAGVMLFKPTHAGDAEGVSVIEKDGHYTITRKGPGDNSETYQFDSLASLEENEVAANYYHAFNAMKKKPAAKAGDLMIVALCVALTALCWGAYGPVLHRGQMKMSGSRLRPFLCVGLAYFLIAVLAPIPLLSSQLKDPPGWFFVSGSIWSLAGGAAGAIGALGIIYAFNFGGKPILVMPLVFGGAPVVNTFVTTIGEGLYNQIQPLFWLSLLLVILGAVTVLVFAPKSHPPKPDAPNSEPVKKPPVLEKEEVATADHDD
jgi:hypothetical protein